jgi:hypothetical protein
VTSPPGRRAPAPTERTDRTDRTTRLPPAAKAATGRAAAPPDEPTGVVGRAWARIATPRPPVPEQVVLRGKPRPVAHPREKRPLLGRRLAVVYDTAGPKVTLGVVWFVALIGGLVVGPKLLVPLYALVAALAGLQAATAWRTVGSGAVRWAAAVGAALVVVGATWGVGSMGLAVLLAAAVALGAAALHRTDGGHLLEAAGTTLLVAVPAGVAAAGVVLTLRLEIGAAVTLVLLVAGYEVGDFLVGSGASSSLEGPIAGIVAIAALCFGLGVLRVPPFDGFDVFAFGGFAALLCPLGQVVGSMLLPSADAPAPALRRLDSLLLLGPVWPLLVGIFLEQLA